MGIGDKLSSSLGDAVSRIRLLSKRKTDQVFISVIGFFCVLIGGIFLFEFMRPVPGIEKLEDYSIELFISKDADSTTSESYLRVKNNSTEWPEMEKSPLNTLVEFNMFDAKAVQEATESVEGARDSLMRAQASFEQGDFAAALRLAKEAERQSPGLAGAKDLIEKAQEAQNQQ